MPRTPYTGRKYTREQLLEAWEASESINECIKKLNMRVSGAAYKSISKILAYEGLIEKPVETATSYSSVTTYGEVRIIDWQDPDSFLCEKSPATTSQIKRYLHRNKILNSMICHECGVDEWRGQKLTMHLDHINGDNRNHSLSNLRFLCPNCHSCTETFGKRKTRKEPRVCISCEKNTLPDRSKTNICKTCRWKSNLNPEFTPSWNSYPFSKADFIQTWENQRRLQDIAFSLFGTKNSRKQNIAKNIANYLNLPIDHIINSQVGIKRNLEDVETVISKFFVENSPHRNKAIISRILDYGLIRHVCECGIEDEYNGKPITLQLEHINGIRNDNRLENLKFLCPSCHSLTDTYCGRNIESRKETCSNEECSNVRGRNVRGLCESCNDLHLTTCECGNEKERTRKKCPECRHQASRNKDKGRLYHECVDCGVKIRKRGRCLHCHLRFSAANIPRKGELIETLTSRGGKLYGVGDVYGVSDNAVIKWLKKYEIPHHSKDLKRYLGVPV